MAGRNVLNGPLDSRDVDLFDDSQERLEVGAEADATSPIECWIAVAGTPILTGKRDAEIQGLNERLRLK